MTPPLAALRCIAVGLLAAHCAFARGAERVIVIDREEFRLQFARDNVKNGRVDTINIKGGWVGGWACGGACRQVPAQGIMGGWAGDWFLSRVALKRMSCCQLQLLLPGCCA